MPYVIASPCIDVTTSPASRSARSTASTRGTASATSTPRSASTAAPASRSARSRRSARTAGWTPTTRSSSRTTAASSPRSLPGRDEPLGAPGGAHKVGELGVDTPLVAGLGMTCSTAPSSSTPTCTSRCSGSLAPAWMEWARDFGPDGILEDLWDADGRAAPGPARRAVRGAGRRRGAAVLRVQPEGHRQAALRGPAADRRAEPAPVPAGGQRQPAPALPDRGRGEPPARPRRGRPQAAPRARRVPVRRPRRSTRPTRCWPSAACRWSCTAAPAPSPAR